MAGTGTTTLPIDIRPLNQSLAAARPDDVFDELPDETVLKTGWLSKKGRRGNWKRRWFVLRSDRLAYYKDEKEYKTLRIIPALDINTVTSIKSKKPHKSEAQSQEWIKSLLHASQLSAHRCEEELQSLDPSNPPPVRTTPPLAPLDTTHLQHLPAATSPQRGPSMDMHRVNSFESSGGYFSGPELSPSPGGEVLPARGGGHSPVVAATSPHVEGRQSFETDELEGLAEDRVVCQGYLLCLKNVSGVRQWKRRWVVLRGRSLTLYKNFEEYKPLRIIPLQMILAAVDVDPLSRSKRHCFQVVTKEKILRFCADSEGEVDKWLGGLVSLIEAGKATTGQGLGGSNPV